MDRWIRIGGILIVVLLALGLRLWAADRLGVDFDEPIYLEAAHTYGQLIRAGDWAAIPQVDINTVHPPACKLLYGAVIAPAGAGEPPAIRFGTPPPQDEPTFGMARRTAAVGGTLHVLAVAIVSPAAGFFLAVNTYAIKYTAEIYLEALPMLTSTLCVLAYIRSGRRLNGWLVASAVALGLTAAAKYIYCVVGLAIVLDWGRALLAAPPDEPRQPLLLVGWGLVAVVCFVGFNPYLWPAPAERLASTLPLSVTYSAQNASLEELGYTFYQPFRWLFEPVPWHPEVIITRYDGLVAVLGLLGLGAMWQRHPVIVLWWAVGMAFLLVWPAKFPQYILIVVVPVGLCAVEGTTRIAACFGAPERILRAVGTRIMPP
ncbi:MAG: hypothetical protein ACFB51_13230 [Anaerolineae bacterium]